MFCHAVPEVVNGNSTVAGPPTPPSNFSKWFPVVVPAAGLILKVMVLFRSSAKFKFWAKSNCAVSYNSPPPTTCATIFPESSTKVTLQPS